MVVLVLDAAGIKQWRLSGLGHFQGIVDDTVVVTLAGRLSRVDDAGVTPLADKEAESFAPRLHVLAQPPGWTAERLALNPQRISRSLSVGGRSFTVALDYDGDVENVRVLSEGEVEADVTVVRGVRRLDRASYDDLFAQ